LEKAPGDRTDQKPERGAFMGGCGCCCAAQQPPPPTDGGQKRCDKYKLTIDSISVSQIDDGWFGGNLEADFTFVVNGIAQHYVNNDLGTGVTNIGISFFVDVPADTSTISFQVSGIEHDPFFDDTLAGFTQVFGQAQNWGLGSESGSASDSNITYTLNYTITCAHTTTIAVSRIALTTYAEDRLRTRKKATAQSPTALIAWPIDRLRRAGWEVVGTTEQHVLFKGVGNLPALLDRKYARGDRKERF
jgi:hypothetical protein